MVPDGVERDHVDVVLDLLCEAERQARKPLHNGVHRKVAALGVRRVDMALVGIAGNHVGMRADTLCWAIAAVRFDLGARATVDLHELRIVHVITKGAFHGLPVGAMAVRG